MNIHIQILGSKTTMTSGEWKCLISFATAPLTCSERGGNEKFKIKICLQRDSNPYHTSPRKESQRLRPLGHKGLMVISGLMSYRIMGYKFFKKLLRVNTCQLDCGYMCISLCPKSPSARGFIACLPVRLLFKSTKHNAFYPISSLPQCDI